MFKTLGVRAYGVGFLALVVFFVYMTYAVFTKQFASYDRVTLESSKIGLSLPARADVKIRGVIVGEVLSVKTAGDGAALELGIFPDKTSVVPSNVTAMILPKTLFGEKYVALQVPASPASPIKDGDTIKQATVSIELEKLLNDLFPLLRTVQPEQLNYTLSAIANALEGRGNKIGDSLVTLDDYLKRMNPQVPALIDSLDKLGQVSSVYNAVVPDLARLLRNSVTTGGTFQSNEDQIQALFDDTAGFSNTAREFLNTNGSNLITLADQGRQILPMVARYSPEFKCFLDGAVGLIPRNESAFRDKTLHIILETIPHQPRGYNAGDVPRYADTRGAFPYCNLMYKALNGFYTQNNLPPSRLVPDIKDGVQGDTGKRVAPGDAVIGTAADKQVLNMAASPVMQRSVGDVPDLASLLLGPLARGMAVNVR